MLGNKITSEMYERERFIKVAHDMGIDFNVPEKIFKYAGIRI